MLMVASFTICLFVLPTVKNLNPGFGSKMRLYANGLSLLVRFSIECQRYEGICIPSQ